MVTFLIAVQYLGIAVLMVEILYIFRQKTSKLQLLMLLVTISTLVNFVGYLFEMRATTKEMALQAVKFIYLGKPYIILGILLFIIQYYKVKIPAPIKHLICAVHIGITILVWECERQTLYYKSIDFVQDGLFPHLVLGKGIAYLVFSALIVIYLTFILFLGVVHYRRTTDRAEHIRILYLSAVALIAAAGLAIYFSGLTKGYDSTLMAYVVCTILLFISILRYNLLDTMDVVKERVMDEFSNGLVVLDKDRRLVYANPVAVSIYPALASREHADAFAELEEFSRLKEQFLKNDRVYQVQEKSLEQDGIVYGDMYIISDITEIHDYTVELEKQKIIAEMANKAKSDFLAKMSHEIRTPINSVLGMNEMILRESRDGSILNYAKNVKSSANALLGLINEILDLSKIESGKLEILPEEYELGSLLNDVIHMIYVRARDKELELKIEVLESLPNGLFGDDVRLRQILINLLTNAVKYTMEGSVTLRVSGKTEKGKLLLHCEVEDTGIGIRPEDMPKLYASFERIDENRNRGIEGTGLGMSIVIDLLKLMGSKLSVESRYGEGTRFWFDIEQEVRSEVPVGDFSQHGALKEGERYRALFTAEDAKILLVDDNDVNRSVFCQLLKETRVQITDVASGLQCLAQLSGQHFDIIFLDHMMPGMDGIETLQKMKRMEDNLSKEAPVIVLTANAIKGAREQYLEAGFDDFLTKPIIPEKLEHMLMQYLPAGLVKKASSEEDSEAENTEENPTVQTDDSDESGVLPELEEFDLALARKNLHSDELIRSTMLQIYLSMDEQMKTLDDLAYAIQNGESEKRAIGEYRILVHTLKSTFATVGAVLMSKLARLSEVAAIENDTEKLLRLHPVLIEELKKHRERLAVLWQSDEKTEAVDAEALIPILEKLATALEERDYDEADALVQKLDGIAFNEILAEPVSRLKMQVMNLQADDGAETARQICKSLQAADV